MKQQKHIINKQILEIHLSKKEGAFAVQQKLNALYHEQWLPIIDKALSEQIEGNEDQLQIERLTIDLGVVPLKDITTLFAEKFTEKITTVIPKEDYSVKTPTESNKSPLRIVSYFLNSGILPWWVEDASKEFLKQQLALLLKTKDTQFRQIVGQLRFNRKHLERFINTFSEQQLLASLELATSYSEKNIFSLKEKVLDTLKKKAPEKIAQTSEIKVAKIFWQVAFQHLATAKHVDTFQENCLQQMQLEIGIDPKNVNNEYPTRESIRYLVKKYKTQNIGNPIWQEFFQEISLLINSNLSSQINPKLLKGLERLLINLNTTSNDNAISNDNASSNDTTDRLKPLLPYLELFQTNSQQPPTPVATNLIAKQQSAFEDTDFIPIQNAGLVLFWPFLPRFFENLGLLDNKDFLDEAARNKAICALQYLCGTTEEELFEGTFPLNKILCGASLEEVIPSNALVEAEQEMANDLLQAVIQRGPKWTNLSVDGFQASYVCRPGSLRTRDGHWLLQVQKETFDITLEKLPWALHTVKLPWMDEILIVEWI